MNIKEIVQSLSAQAASRLSIVTRGRPRVVAGRCRRLLLWTDTFAPELEAAAVHCAAEPDMERGLARLFALLDLAYALVAIERVSGVITLAAGHNNVHPLYFSNNKDGVAIRDALPCASPEERLRHLDPDGFADFIARTIVAGPYELSTHTPTFDRRWRTVPPGQRLVLDPGGRVLRSGIADRVFEGIHDAIGPPAHAIDDLREALDRRLLRLAQRGPVASEFSGGIDSSIVRARCRARIAARYRGGVTCRFPYVEFMRETEMQEAVLAQAPGPVAIVGHRGFLPFAALSEVPWHDAPTVASTAWGAFASAAGAARQAGARVLLNGHGGDTLFRWHPAQMIRYALPADLARWLPPRLCRDVEARAHAIAAGLNAGPGEGFGGLWHPGMFDPCHPTALVRRGDPGMDYVSGLAAREVLRAAARLWLANPPHAPGVQKPFAHAAFRADLPEALWRRPGKVDHLGIVYRGAIAARQDILRVARRGGGVLDALGLPRKVFPEFAEAATRGVDSGNPMFSIMLAVLLWADQPSPDPVEHAATEQDWNLNTDIFKGNGGESTTSLSGSIPIYSTTKD